MNTINVYIDSIVSLFRQGLAGDNRQGIEQSKSSHRKEISRTAGGVVRRHDARGRQRCRGDAQQFISIFSRRRSRRRRQKCTTPSRRERASTAPHHILQRCSGGRLSEGGNCPRFTVRSCLLGGGGYLREVELQLAYLVRILRVNLVRP